jgi:hypothetical protein
MGLASSRCRSWRKVKTEAWREVNKECGGCSGCCSLPAFRRMGWRRPRLPAQDGPAGSARGPREVWVYSGELSPASLLPWL